MFCPNCGASLPENAKFCTGCGTPIQQAAPAPQPQPQMQPQQPQYQQPQQPQYQQPQQPQYQQPQQPQHQQPQQPQYQQPQQPQYQQPQQGYYDPAAVPAGYAAVPMQNTVPGAKGVNKKIIIITVAALAVISLAVFLILFFLKGGGDDIVGKWHCTKMASGGESYTAEEYEERFGVSFAGLFKAEFESDGTGKIALGDETQDFSWEKDDDTYTVEIDKDKSKATAKFKDDQLVLTIKTSTRSIVYTFDKGDAEADSKSASALDEYVGKSKLKTVNTAAKLVFTTVNSEISWLIADGKRKEINDGLCGPVDVDDLDTSDPLQKAVKTAMEENGSDSGTVSFYVEGKKVQWAQYAEDEDSEMVGQYPDPESDPEKEHTIGDQF